MIDPSLSGHSPNLTKTEALAAFELNLDYLHLNHGSYGAVPRTVRLTQDRIRAEIERNPTGFYGDDLPPAMRRMAGEAAKRFGGLGQDWVFCENATAAVSAVLYGLDLKPGDEILTTSHAYGAVLKAIALVAERRGAQVKLAQLSAILESEDAIVQSIERELGPRVRLLIVDHITSATATVFPVRQIAALARNAGIPILVDGAHAPGQIMLDVPALGADWYTGNAHKWLFAPRGCGLLWTAPERQDLTRPAVLSHGTDHGYTAAFDWVGTRDPSPWLCFEAAALAHDGLGGAGLMARNRGLAALAARELSTALGARATAPESMRAAMATLTFEDCPATEQTAASLRRILSEVHRMMVPVHAFGGRLSFRISAQIYNALGDYQKLAEVCRPLFRA
ncbi:MAG TPA: aminotransferase class V-fold PLP-dependent enzyme [Rhizomicrobium sp.]|jgi:isopenicillin-N epimerase|nr:aminotransferase class V-fold PLP-dependent enzyme [Rhizomicrobium sp.]